MIKYSLKCDQGHQFESWFASGDAYDTLHTAGHVGCITCGSGKVEKAIMAPRVSTARSKADTQEQADAQLPAKPPSAPSLSTPANEAETAIAKMRTEVEKNATYVGGNFAKQARDMHLGDAPERPIWGQANITEAKAFIEDGVPVLPLPFIPTRKAN